MSAYGLLLDYERQAQWDLSTTTYGGFFDGKAKLSDSLDLIYRLEYARQQDAGENPDHIGTDYGRADLGLSISKVTIAAGYEVLGGSPEDGQFRTPLATLPQVQRLGGQVPQHPDRRPPGPLPLGYRRHRHLDTHGHLPRFLGRHGRSQVGNRDRCRR